MKEWLLGHVWSCRRNGDIPGLGQVTLWHRRWVAQTESYLLLGVLVILPPSPLSLSPCLLGMGIAGHTLKIWFLCSKAELELNTTHTLTHSVLIRYFSISILNFVIMPDIKAHCLVNHEIQSRFQQCTSEQVHSSSPESMNWSTAQCKCHFRNVR